jgi:hypothetical protein
LDKAKNERKNEKVRVGSIQTKRGKQKEIERKSKKIEFAYEKRLDKEKKPLKVKKSRE